MDENWDDLRLFYYVAEGGGLSAAAVRTGISAPTIGRRMLALERRLNRYLFERSNKGYVLAVDGKVLLAQVKEMARISGEIDQWRGGTFLDPFVGVGGDAWMTLFLAGHSGFLCRGAGDVNTCFMDAHQGLSMVNRDCDVALVCDPPRAGNLAVRPLVQIAYAVYQNPSLGQDADRAWVSIGKEESASPADRWVFERCDNGICGWTNNPYILLEMILSGRGRGVLPCFIGDRRDGLERSGEVIEELTSRIYLVVNDDDRRRSEIRLVMDRLSQLLTDHAALFAGQEG